MRVGKGDLTFPLPWSSVPDTNALSPPEEYKAALAGAGFNLLAERNRRVFAMAFFTQLRAAMANAGGPPPLGLHLLMGETTPEKIKNVQQVHRIALVAARQTEIRQKEETITIKSLVTIPASPAQISPAVKLTTRRIGSGVDMLPNDIS